MSGTTPYTDFAITVTKMQYGDARLRKRGKGLTPQTLQSLLSFKITKSNKNCFLSQVVDVPVQVTISTDMPVYTRC
jgi:hypothetical protein